MAVIKIIHGDESCLTDPKVAEHISVNTILTSLNAFNTIFTFQLKGTNNYTNNSTSCIPKLFRKNLIRMSFFLENYLKDIQNGVCDVKATPTIDKETAATALVNGNNGFGAITGKFCMELAIKKAKEIGIGIVAAHCKYFIKLTASQYNELILSFFD